MAGVVIVGAVAFIMSCCPPSMRPSEEGSESGSSTASDASGSNGDGIACSDDAIAAGSLCFEHEVRDELSGVQQIAVGNFDDDEVPELAAIHVEGGERRLSVIDFSEATPRLSNSSSIPGFGTHLLLVGADDAEGLDILVLDASGGGPPLHRFQYDGQTLSPASSEVIPGGIPFAGAALDLDSDGRTELFLLILSDEGTTQGALYERVADAWNEVGNPLPFTGALDRIPAAQGNVVRQTQAELVTIAGGLISGPEDYDPDVHRLAVYSLDSATPSEIGRVPVGVVPASVHVGDLDGDGRDDIVVASASSTLSILEGTDDDEPAPFTLLQAGPTSGGPRVSLADLDGDSALDLVVAAGTLGFYLDPLGGGPLVSLPVGLADELAVGDLNRDGLADMVYVRRQDGRLGLLLSRP